MKIKLTFFVVLALFSVSGIVSADYNVSQYDASYTPYNLQAAIDHGNCGDEIEAFDQVYQEMRAKLRDGYNPGTGNSLAQATRGAENWRNEIERTLINNDLDTEDALSECLRGETKEEEETRKERQQEREDEREEEIRMGLVICDLDLMEDLDEEEQEDYAERLQPCVDARNKVIEAAVAICDFDFFENEMSRDERNSWFTERKECEENPPSLAPQVEPEVVSNVVYNPTPPAVVPVNTVSPSIETPVAQENQLIADTVTSEILDGGDLVEDIEAAAEGQTESTTTEELIEVTPDELERLVEQRMAEQQEQQSQAEEVVEPSESKPTFFRRVVDFFFGWF